MQTAYNRGMYRRPGICSSNIAVLTNIDFVWQIETSFIYLFNSALPYQGSDSVEVPINVSADEDFIILTLNLSSSISTEPHWKKNMPSWCRSVWKFFWTFFSFALLINFNSTQLRFYKKKMLFINVAKGAACTPRATFEIPDEAFSQEAYTKRDSLEDAFMLAFKS